MALFRMKALNGLYAPAAALVMAGAFTGLALLRAQDRPLLQDEAGRGSALAFDVRSVRDGAWSAPSTWNPPRVPRAGDRVLIARGTTVRYDVQANDVIRLVQVAGTLRFDPDLDTRLEVGILKVQRSETCSESGFACDLFGANAAGEPQIVPPGGLPLLEVGTPEKPTHPDRTARIRLHYLEGMDARDAPALVCCAARMELHGAPRRPAWVKLGADARPGDRILVLSRAVEGWRAGDEIIVTGSRHRDHLRTFRPGRPGAARRETELRRIESIAGRTIRLDRPLEHEHDGRGEFRSEVAVLSRNVIVESADAKGVRGHTLYHRFSRGGISYVRFAHLGKEGVLGRYPIHFHRVGDTMRGASVIGAAVVDSHNRWITIHGTRYLVVRDCVGYMSVGHGFFLEDGTEVYNLLDRNLGVHAFAGRPLPDQVLPYDPNDGAAFWWANGRNTFVRNVSCENDTYGFRYDARSTSRFDSRLRIVMPDGTRRRVDIRTIPIYRFEANEAHTEGLYGMVFAGNNQHGSPLGGLEALEKVDRTGPDTRHPHILRGLRIWEVHYALRPQIPCMWIEDVSIDRAVYGIYRPMFENQVYRKIRIARTHGEPFNRGMDDASTQYGIVTVDDLVFEGFRNSSIPLIQLSDNNPTGRAAIHFRNIRIRDRHDGDRRALVDRGGGARVDPVTPTSVPVYIHDWYGPGRHARIVSKASRDLKSTARLREDPPLTGREALVEEVEDVEFPRVLEPADDLPPATIVLAVERHGGGLLVRGVSHDNGEIAAVEVNGVRASVVEAAFGVADWEARIPYPQDGKVTAGAADAAGNRELTPHTLALSQAESTP